MLTAALLHNVRMEFLVVVVTLVIQQAQISHLYRDIHPGEDDYYGN
jgi:hypothetical protein